jgi:hypothetical protein
VARLHHARAAAPARAHLDPPRRGPHRAPASAPRSPAPLGGERGGKTGVGIRMGPERGAAGGEKKKGRQGEEK